jgi:methylthioribose-1-phosphate isomerase
VKYRTVYWHEGRVRMIDQTLLPEQFKEIDCEDLETLWEAIRNLRVRGAPAIGIAAALGVALTAERSGATSVADLRRDIDQACEYLASSRPTAVNLFWALDRMKRVTEQHLDCSVEEIRRSLLAEAERMIHEDNEVCQAIGRNGAALLRNGDTVLTHCNAGALATAGYGTALGVIYAACEQGKRLKVYADETRPLLQGARLTAWELLHAGVDVTLICDDMAATVMRNNGVSAVIVGADRIAANGDFANKIGTYGLAVLAKEHEIPFYTAAPLSTIDLSTSTGEQIPIEERGREEIVRGFGKLTAPNDVPVYNPAFDVTPAKYLAGIITERGVLRPPFDDSIKEAFASTGLPAS